MGPGCGGTCLPAGRSPIRNMAFGELIECLHAATNKEQQVCARRRAGEAAGFQQRPHGPRS
jgi:hypothetical protein